MKDWRNWIKNNWFYVIVIVVAICIPAFMPNRYTFQIVIMSCLMAVGALSFNLLLGFTGQASLAHGAFFGIGAYGASLLALKLGWSFWIALPVGAAIAALIGMVVGIPTLRTRGAYFAIATMCLGEIITLVAGNWMELTGGHNGLVGIPTPTPIRIPGFFTIDFNNQVAQYYLVLIFLLIVIFFMRRLVYSLKGLTFMAVRNNELLAEAIGINTFRTKLLSFVVSTFIVGLAGGIYASLIGSISPTVASIKITFDFLLFTLLGGMATIAGPVIGSFGLLVLMEYLQFLQEYQMIIFGVLLVAVIVYFPRGFMGAFMKIKSKMKKAGT
ncbi:MAG: branched-chain amino acid ABC transporter permease [Syntrophales bacterium]|nr:branched-chain amino acid ABC transporter permease [Syntrophales bacterium]